MVAFNGGMAPDMLLHVTCPCICGAALRMHSLVGLAIVVIGGTSATFSVGPSPSEITISSTLWGGAGSVAAIFLRVFAIVCKIFLFCCQQKPLDQYHKLTVHPNYVFFLCELGEKAVLRIRIIQNQHTVQLHAENIYFFTLIMIKCSYK